MHVTYMLCAKIRHHLCHHIVTPNIRVPCPGVHSESLFMVHFYLKTRNKQICNFSFLHTLHIFTVKENCYSLQMSHSLKTTVFWSVLLCSLGHRYCCFTASSYLHLQGRGGVEAASSLKCSYASTRLIGVTP